MGLLFTNGADFSSWVFIFTLLLYVFYLWRPTSLIQYSIASRGFFNGYIGLLLLLGFLTFIERLSLFLVDLIFSGMHPVDVYFSHIESQVYVSPSQVT
jgi:hypothetical protein